MRIILFQTILFGISNGILSSMLNAHQHFALPALAPIALDIGYLIGLFYLVPRYGIHGLAWGTVISGFLHILIQVPAFITHRLKLKLQLDLALASVHEVVRLMGPRVITLGAIQFADLFIIRLASGLPSGSTSGYFYGYALMQFPETLLGTAVAVVIFPTLAELYNAGDKARLKETAVTTLGIIWTLTIPAAIGIVMLSRPVLVTFLEGGAFGPESTQIVYSVLLVFSVRIISEATVEVVARLLYAQHDTRTPMFVYLGWLLINIALAYLFVQTFQWGVMGLAGASTVAFTFLAVVLFLINRRRLGGFGERQLGLVAGRAVLAGGGMALTIYVLNQLIASPLLYLLVATVVGGAIYLLLSWVLGGREIQQAWQLVRSRNSQ
jgi:putative peptidoglycan lipid II flippase